MSETNNAPEQKHKYQVNQSAEIITEKYKTDLIIRPKYSKNFFKEQIIPVYNTTPGDKYTCRHICGKGRQFSDNGKELFDKGRRFRDKPINIPERNRQLENTGFRSSQSEYLINNLGIKSGIGNRDVPMFQLKRISIRNYRPKILIQEINLGMWI